MKVLVTGANGQLGSDIVRLLRKQGHVVYAHSRDTLDITRLEQCRDVLHAQRPDVIIHCAAYTSVDKAESDEDGAYLVNAVGSRNIAVAAEQIEAKLCYMSTDYVFDGESAQAYREYDLTNPQTIYGKSKLAGEQLVQTLSSKYFIVRTSWVYGAQGQNFVKTMLKLGKEKSSLQVVQDQVGSPTYTVDLASFLEKLIRTEYYGIYHASNSGSCSWYEFAQVIFEEAGIKIELLPCTTEQFPRPARRPKNSALEHLSIRTNGFEDMRGWRDALIAFMQEMKQAKEFL